MSKASQQTPQPDLFGDAAPQAARARKVTTYVIPAVGSGETRESTCRGAHCHQRVYWVSGVPVPLSPRGDGCYPPTQTKPGVGQSHFNDCPDAADFRSERSDSTAR